MPRKKKSWVVVMVAVLAVGVGSARADFVDDMESVIGNWQMTDGAATVLSSAADNGPSAAGSQALSIENTSTSGIVGGAQSTGIAGTYIPLTPNTDYTLSFDYKSDGDVYFAFQSFVTVEAGGGSDSSASADFVSSYPGYAWNEWVTVTLPKTTGPDAVKLYMSFYPASGESTTLLDNVSFTVIPESATTSLIGIGALALLCRLRRERS